MNTGRQPHRNLIGHAFEFRSLDSPVHRIGAGWKLLTGCAMSAAAFAARDPWILLTLLMLNLVYYAVSRLRFADLWRDIRFFLIQMVIVVALYLLRTGFPKGLWPGIRTSVQIVLFFMPGIVLLRTTRTSDMMRSMRRVLPAGMAFIVFTSLRFVPFFARELHEIYMAQRLRGAPLAPRLWWDPRNWKEAFHCLMVPLVVRALKTAREAALSAEARGFGRDRPATDGDNVGRVPQAHAQT